ncbi:hypothetical protein [Nocardia harenae]|uniref:hypothetical protein n=1 Tax=Nocardia harenae TaxID=358707 RepID=UPI000829D877|nr:hypothetical protein [Nocardia harenae]
MTGTLTRLAGFTRVMYKPHYLLYGILWVFALEATLALLAETPWRPSPATGLRVLVVAIVLLYLRMVDEQKDLGYDRVHNKDRPLVTGAVTGTDLRIGMAVIAALAVAGSLLLSVGSALAIAAVLLYGLGLWGLERISAWVRDDILVNLVVTYPVQLLVTAYVLISVLDTEALPAGFWQSAPAALIFAGAFLQFEFARKTAHGPRPGEHYYSNVLGAPGSTAASLLFVALAVGADLALVRPWNHSMVWLGLLPVPLALLPGYGAVRFLRGGEYPVGPPVLFILGLYAVLIAQGAVGA